jgi:cytochrome P450
LAFNPERFDPEFGGVKSFRDRCVLLPFGDGPRICLGMKLGIIIIKTLIAETLKNFEVSVNEKTPKKLKISATELLNVPDADVMLNFEKKSF